MSITEETTRSQTNAWLGTNGQELDVAADSMGIPGGLPKFAGTGLTFDDVLLIPAQSDVIPSEVSTATQIAPGLTLNIPILSAAMDTVTEARLAIAIARAGGLGIIHRNLSIAEQISEIDKVKRSESGMIVEPVTLPADAQVSDALAVMERYHISGVPITDDDGKLVGILTNRDLRFVEDVEQPVANLMTSEGLITCLLYTSPSPRDRG
jgi:IMP dehydrogenase